MTTDSVLPPAQPPKGERAPNSEKAVGQAAESSTGSITITIRLIKSFEYRTFKNVVLHGVLPDTTMGQIKTMVLDTIKSTPGYKPFLSVQYGKY